MSPINYNDLDSKVLGLACISDDMASGTKLVEMIKSIFALKDKIIAEKNKEIEIKNNNIFSLSQQLNTIKFYKNYKDQEESSDKNNTLKDHEIAEKDLEIQEKNELVTSLYQELKNIEEQLEEQKSKIINLSKENEVKNEKIVSISQELMLCKARAVEALKANKQKLFMYQEEISDKNKTDVLKNHEIAEKDLEITEKNNLVKTLSQGLTFVRKQYEDQKSIIINLSQENQAKRDELVEKNHHLAILQHSMSKMVLKSAISNKAEIETINNLSKLIDTQDQEIAQKDLEIMAMKNNGDCRENIEIMENLFTEIDEAKDQLERKNHESTILKKELGRRIKENIFNKEEIVKKTEKIENQDEIIAMNDKKIAKMDQENIFNKEEIVKKTRKIENQDEIIAMNDKKIAKMDQEIAKMDQENIFNKEEIVKKTKKIENQDEIIAMNDKKIAKMDQEIAKMDQEIVKKAKQILEAFFEHQEEMMK